MSVSDRHTEALHFHITGTPVPVTASIAVTFFPSLSSRALPGRFHGPVVFHPQWTTIGQIGSHRCNLDRIGSRLRLQGPDNVLELGSTGSSIEQRSKLTLEALD